jgi:hypothetical protein
MLRGGGVMSIVCHYCGHTSHSMMEATRHEADRPESCFSWRQPTNSELMKDQAEIDAILQLLTVEDGGNLGHALDDYFERIAPIYQ